MTIEEAVTLLRAMYDKSLTIPHIFNPVAWALYQTWREADARNGRRRDA